ncbi:hypothetical protein MICRO80W_860001 [Micrococcus luteus]|nr:hypothetical protein MICRO80W_860001 [Micrococcus luteus]
MIGSELSADDRFYVRLTAGFIGTPGATNVLS